MKSNTHTRNVNDDVLVLLPTNYVKSVMEWKRPSYPANGKEVPYLGKVQGKSSVPYHHAYKMILIGYR